MELAALCEQLITAPLIVVDVGAADGFHELPRLAHLCILHEFEPRADSTKPPRFPTASTVQHNSALAAERGRRKLHITKSLPASSMLRPNQEIIRRWRRDDIFDVTNELIVECTTLDQFAKDSRLDQIDYLKIDTQGTELEVLRGGKQILGRTAIIRIEVEFVELYENQPLFCDVVQELAPHGFRFVDFTDSEFSNGKRIWSDALFVKKHEHLTQDSALRASALLFDLGYATDATWLLLDTKNQAASGMIKAARRGARTRLHKTLHWLRAKNRSRQSAGKFWLDTARIRQSIGFLRR
jgi:FkbM family methyltransferase